RVDWGSGWPKRVIASPPKGRWTSSRRSAWTRATSARTREVSAISSGPPPSPARHATVQGLLLILGSLSIRSLPVVKTHLSCSEVGVCGTRWPRERILPLEGENRDGHDDDPRRRGRKGAGRHGHHCPGSVPKAFCAVKYTGQRA